MVREALRRVLVEIDEAYRRHGIEEAKKVAEKHGYRLVKIERKDGGVWLYLDDRRGGDIRENIILEIYDDGKTYFQIKPVWLATLVPGRWRQSPTSKTSYYYPR